MKITRKIVQSAKIQHIIDSGSVKLNTKFLQVRMLAYMYTFDITSRTSHSVKNVVMILTIKLITKGTVRCSVTSDWILLYKRLQEKKLVANCCCCQMCEIYSELHASTISRGKKCATTLNEIFAHFAMPSLLFISQPLLRHSSEITIQTVYVQHQKTYTLTKRY